MGKRILIIDNDMTLYSGVEHILLAEGHTVSFLHSNEICGHRDVRKHDLIVLGVKPSSSAGWDKMRKYSIAPVLLIADRWRVEEILESLSMGVDDYVVKPFDPDELCARIENLLRRKKRSISTELDETFHDIHIGHMVIRPSAREVQVREQWIDCTPKQFALLCYFSRNPEKVVSRKELLEEIWGISFTGSVRTVDTQVKELRKKLGKVDFEDACIVTVWCKGYKFVVEPKTDKKVE